MIDPLSLEITRIVTDALDALGVPYVIGGSFASIIYGKVRATQDVDIVAEVRQEHVSGLIDAFHDRFYIADSQSLSDAIQRRRSFNLIHLDTMFKVDLFPTRDRAFDQQQVQRRLRETFGEHGGFSLWVLSPEDLVLAKLDWFRQGGEVSERQWRDVLDVLSTQGSSLDQAYMSHWATDLSVSDLLDHALAESGFEI